LAEAVIAHLATSLDVVLSSVFAHCCLTHGRQLHG
ncbi:MAG: hypothetical protein ACI94O_002291, partial [Octadecabacter sp.]